jgi:hypothetical protein
MQIAKRIVALVLCVCFLNLSMWAGVGTQEAVYVGGTISGIKEKTEGKPFLREGAFVFEHDKNQKFEILYASINSLEYGQKAGRRLGLALAVSPLFLFSKKRKHFLTIGFMDGNNKQQAMVLQLGKSVIGPTLKGLEAKTGKKVEFEDAEARKSAEKK